MRQLAIENNVHLFLLPPHTTHRLQPLDVGIFAHLQDAWVKRCNQFYNTSFGREMDRAEFVREYLDVRRRVFKQSLVRKAWFNSGITSGTWSASFFNEADFAPSYATSTRAHVPPSYPDSTSASESAPDPHSPPASLSSSPSFSSGRSRSPSQSSSSSYQPQVSSASRSQSSESSRMLKSDVPTRPSSPAVTSSSGTVSRRTSRQASGREREPPGRECGTPRTGGPCQDSRHHRQVTA